MAYVASWELLHWWLARQDKGTKEIYVLLLPVCLDRDDWDVSRKSECMLRINYYKCYKHKAIGTLRMSELSWDSPAEPGTTHIDVYITYNVYIMTQILPDLTTFLGVWAVPGSGPKNQQSLRIAWIRERVIAVNWKEELKEEGTIECGLGREDVFVGSLSVKNWRGTSRSL